MRASPASGPPVSAESSTHTPRPGTPGNLQPGSRRALPGAVGRALHPGRVLLGLLRRSFANAFDHDCFNLSQSAAHSAMVALFPALIVSAAAIALLPDTGPLRTAIGEFFDEVLPPDVFPLLTSYFVNTSKSPTTARTLVLASLVSISGASSVVSILMEGIRRALDLPRDGWGFWARRRRALILVPLAAVPFALATVIVVFGRYITEWIGSRLDDEVLQVFFGAALVIRWIVALAGVAGLVSMIYHLGIPTRLRWFSTLPGAAVATLMWLASTLLFGWYVTRFANYSQVYGSLGAGIALLFWLYLVFFSVLVGAEFNAELARRARRGSDPRTPPATPAAADSLPSSAPSPPLAAAAGAGS